ncbi:hypothetical protein GCM10011506_46670 [Marivirga lumbricoides]|uniref:Uncharacterized protein n=1 Tax=Marivirga lumbricoides TaxID=1046115 RepID=A0ABQ1N9S6_9BACT|nr:hypothetical protein GCM10011506_46670 [Marivirga lumbricoides]
MLVNTTKAGNYRHPRNFWRATEKIIRDPFNEVSLPDFSSIIEKIASWTDNDYLIVGL